jgi:hypothetical protein
MGRPLRTATYTEPGNVSDVVKMEHDSHYCRDAVTLKSGFAVLDIGAVLGQITKAAATAAAKSGGNTGDGTFVIDATTPVLAGAKVGVYKLRCIAAATNSGTFRLEDPDGVVLDNNIVIPAGAGNSVTVAEQIKGALTDGATDFAVGDGFDITVAAGSLKWGPYDPTAVDGREKAAAILLHKHDTTSADVAEAIVLARGPAEVALQGLKWSAGVTTQAHKDAAYAALKALGIVPRLTA